MAVFNVFQPEPLDISPLLPTIYDSANSGSVALSDQDTEAVDAGYDPSNNSAGDLVNDGEATAFILPVGINDPEPTRATVLSNGVPLLSAGSSYQIPSGAKLLFYLACAGGDTSIRCQYFG